MTPLEEGKDEPSENGTTDHRTSKVTITDSVLTFQSSERVDNSCYRRFQRITGKIYKVTSSIFGIIILLVGYSFLGAWIFMIIESDKEPIKVNITNARDAIIGQLLNTNTVTVGSDSSLKERLEQMLVGYEADIMKAYKAGVTTPSTEETWGFWRSLFFCGTVYTTIGEYKKIIAAVIYCLYHKIMRPEDTARMENRSVEPDRTKEAVWSWSTPLLQICLTEFLDQTATYKFQSTERKDSIYFFAKKDIDLVIKHFTSYLIRGY